MDRPAEAGSLPLPSDVDEDEDERLSPSRVLFSTTDVSLVSLFSSTGFKYALWGRLDASGPMLMGSAGAGLSPERDLGLVRHYGATTLTQGRLMLGWQAVWGRTLVAAYAGISHDEQLRTLPAGTVQTVAWGPALQLDIWSRPTENLVVNLAASYSGTDGYSWGRFHVGARVYGGLHVGPELSGTTDGHYRQTRFGLRLTGVTIGPLAFELSAGGFRDSNGHSGPYGTLTLYGSPF